MACSKVAEGFRGELSLTRDFLSFAGELHLSKEEGDKCIETAGSGGDSREGISWCAIRKFPVRTRNISEPRMEEEDFSLNFYRRGREGEGRDDFGETRQGGLNVVLVVLVVPLCSSSSSSSIM